MCGIAGIVGRRPAAFGDLLRGMGGIIAHRGPDDLGYLDWNGVVTPSVGRRPPGVGDTRVGFVHRRLSVLDLSEAGRQPMADRSGRYYISYNGEIYNYVELRSELERLGHVFLSTGDTEVLLAAFSEWGTGVLTRLIGMFAFAILDINSREVVLARDFAGVKPLYYSHWSGGLGFASEIGPLLALPGVSRRAAAAPVFDYLRFGLSDHRPETMLADVRSLPPAHYAVIDVDHPETVTPVRYWRLPSRHAVGLSLDEAACQLRDLFLESVRLQLRSDVPVGTALSGGIDSSAIALGMRAIEGDGLDISSFSYVAREAGLDEENWVDLVVDRGHLVAHKVVVESREFAEGLDQLILSQGEPFGSTSIFAQQQVFRRAAAEGVKVMLDGQGADEMLGGYRGYLGYRVASMFRRGQFGKVLQLGRSASKLPDGGQAWQTILRAASTFAPDSLVDLGARLTGQETLPTWLDESWFLSRDGVQRRRRSRGGRDLLISSLWQSLTETSLPSLLRYEDRNSMAVSIESRVPFLTPQIVEFVLGLPEEFLIGPDGTTKLVFRRAMRGLVPDAILNRRDKLGFSTPELSWLTAMRPWVHDVLMSDDALRVRPLKREAMKLEWDNVLSGTRPFDWRIWRWVNLIRWTALFDVDYV